MLDQAITSLEDAARLAPKNALISYHLGVSYSKAGDDPKARVALERALAIDRNFPLAADANTILKRLVY